MAPYDRFMSLKQRLVQSALRAVAAALRRKIGSRALLRETCGTLPLVLLPLSLLPSLLECLSDPHEKATTHDEAAAEDRGTHDHQQEIGDVNGLFHEKSPLVCLCA